MPFDRAQPTRFSPMGLSDSLDLTETGAQTCISLQNLIPDPTTKDIWICRPSSALQTNFPGFSSPGAISVFKVIGSWVYGLISTQLNIGYDEPFAYNLATNSFAAVANVTSANVPQTQPTTGDWVPPTMDIAGVDVVVTHPGFNGASNGYFGFFDLTAGYSLPRWRTGNLQQSGSIQVLGAITGGSGYGGGTWLNVPLTGGSGTGATADIYVALGVVTTVRIDNWGQGYATTDTLSASNANLGGSGSGFHVSPAAVATTVAGRIQMTVVPTWVRQFNGRSWFGINPTAGAPSVIFTDTFQLGCSNTNQALSFGDNVALVAAAPLGLSSQLGGIVQALMIFKDDSNVVQITGDSSSSTTPLAANTLNVEIGTVAPRSIASTPQGLVFLASDGMRLLNFGATISDPIGVAGSGVIYPFITAPTPTRINAICNGLMLRISLLTSAGVWVEYWFDLARKVWSGPHTFPSTCMDNYNGIFVLAPQAVPGTLYTGSPIPNPADAFVENGVAMTWQLTTGVLPDNEKMSQGELVQLQIKASSVAAVPMMTVTATDQDGNPIQTAVYTFAVAASSYWGTMIWGSGLWASASQALAARRIDFPGPVVYNRLAISVSGSCGYNFRIGDMFGQVRVLGYTQPTP